MDMEFAPAAAVLHGASGSSVEAFCEEAMRAVDTSRQGHLDLVQFRAALRRVFHRYQGVVPQPDETWYGKVYQNYAPRCGGSANLKCVVDVAKQYIAHHDRKSKHVENQTAKAGPTCQIQATKPSSQETISAHHLQSDTQKSPRSNNPIVSTQNSNEVRPKALVAGYSGKVVPTACVEVGNAPGPSFSLASVQVASHVMYPINRDRLAVFDQYDFDPGVLGEGSFGRVGIVTHRITGQKRACKTIGVETAEDWRLVETEIELLKKLDHPHIIRLSECFVDVRCIQGQYRGNIYLVSELCLGGTLLDGFTRRGLEGFGGEAAAAICLQQILSATAHCHSKGIIHRDLKPENVLYATSKPDSVIKVIDFGLADFLQRLSPSSFSDCSNSISECMFDSVVSDEATTKAKMNRAGTFLFMAPEMLHKSSIYSEKVDIWAIGCVLFLLVTGVHPFWNRRMRSQDVREHILQGLVVEHPNWQAAPALVRDITQRLLTMDASRRPSATEALQHSWFQTVRQPVAHSSSREFVCDIPRGVYEGLRRYQASSHLKKAVLKLLAKEVDETRIHGLREVFKTIDTDHDGIVTRDQLLQGMRQHLVFRDLTSEDLEKILPPRTKRQMSCNDFIAAMLVEQGFSRAELLNAFRRFDVRREGRISMEALSDVFKVAGSADKLKAAFREADLGQDGQIDFDDFYALINS